MLWNCLRWRVFVCACKSCTHTFCLGRWTRIMKLEEESAFSNLKGENESPWRRERMNFIVAIARGTQQHCWCTQQFLKNPKNAPVRFSFIKSYFFYFMLPFCFLFCVFSILVCFLHSSACAVRFLSVLVVLVLCFGVIFVN